MRGCRCPKPLIPVNPRMKGSCQSCGRILSPEWTADDTTFAEFWKHLASVFPGDPPSWFEHFRAQCLARDRRGRDIFQYKYLARDNLAEAAEECADLVNYCWLDTLKARRAGTDEGLDLAYTAAYHAALSYKALIDLQAKRKGAP